MTHHISSIGSGLIDYLESQGLSAQLPALVEQLQAEIDRRHEISVISAEPLSDSDKTSISKKVIITFGEHPVAFYTDPLLVSGLLVRFNGQLLDLSIHGRLTDLKEHLV